MARLLLTCLLAVWSGALPAQNADPGDEFERYDLNGDGHLSMAEARQTGIIERFTAMDTSKDGRVSRQEFEAARGQKSG